MTQNIQIISLALIIIGDYQRGISNKRVNAIVNAFDSVKLGVLVVNKRDTGVYAILDGQHRLSAMRILGIKEANCVVLESMTIEEEADYFRRQNENSAALTKYDLYNAGLIAGDQHYLKIRDTLAAHGYQANKYSSPLNVTAIEALSKIIELYGFENLDKTFSYIEAAWFGNTVAIRREMLAGISEFAHRFGDKVTPVMFAEKMKDKLPGTIFYDYRIRSEGRVNFRNAFNPLMRRLLCVVIMDNYNKGLNGASKKRLHIIDNEEV